MKDIKIGLAGFGTVGRGTWELLEKNKKKIKKSSKINISIVGIADPDNSKFENVSIPSECHVYSDAFQLLKDKAIDVVVELIGGETIAKEFVISAIRERKMVVTANKALLAKYGKQIFGEAERNGVAVFYEAAIAGGIPIVKVLKEGLAANEILWISGIINGTTNYILSEMDKRDLGFDEALSEATLHGYAEQDPTLDIDGHDSAHKISLLASIAFGTIFDFDEIPTCGIRGIDERDVRFAKKFGYQIKLLAFAKLKQSLVEVSVEPTLIPVGLLMANVDGPMNAVSVEGNFVGHTLYYGQGAGSHPTASAVVADIIEACGTINTLNGMEQVKTNPEISDHADYKLMRKEDIVSGHYMRLEVSDKPGVLSEITGILASQNVSIDRFFQEKSEDSNAEIILLTHACNYGKIVQIIDMLINLENVKGKPVVFRVEEKA
ncbi:homoserine dehydrogenase [Betaproteobacteria bacterium]|nr:homoserine dehydrogenase [Betaproteobacteria bacterium]